MTLRVTVLALTLLAAGLGAAWWHERTTAVVAREQITRLSRHNAELSFQLKQALKASGSLEERALELDRALGSAKVRTTATESQHVQLSQELHTTKAQLSEREQREVALIAELATLKQEAASDPVSTDSAQIDHSESQRRIAQLEHQLTQLLTRALDEPLAEPEQTRLPQSVAPQVLRVGPSDAFVVIDHGTAAGAEVGQLLKLQRSGEIIAHARISDARRQFALAQVFSSSLKGQLQTGDLVVFTK
jgi:hypothetical protein